VTNQGMGGGDTYEKRSFGGKMFNEIFSDGGRKVPKAARWTSGRKSGGAQEPWLVTGRISRGIVDLYHSKASKMWLYG